MTIAHLFSWTVLTRPKNEVITFFLLCLASIDAALTAIVGDRLLPYWYSTIAAGGICVPTPRELVLYGQVRMDFQQRVELHVGVCAFGDCL